MSYTVVIEQECTYRTQPLSTPRSKQLDSLVDTANVVCQCFYLLRELLFVSPGFDTSSDMIVHLVEEVLRFAADQT